MYMEEYKNAGDLYKAKTFRTIQLKSRIFTSIWNASKIK
jgi:hypothetical protein